MDVKLQLTNFCDPGKAHLCAEPHLLTILYQYPVALWL